MNDERWLSLDLFEGEVFKDIEGYESKYQISNYGRVKSLMFKNGLTEYKREKILTTKTTGGYPHIILNKDGRKTNYTIHYLVAKAFVPNPNNYKEINHIDENSWNNKSDNLEWCSHKYNINYGSRTTKAKSKLSVKIKQFSLNGIFVKEWNSIQETIRYYNNSHIFDVCKGKRNTASGYKWFYSED